jgi:oligopeptide/dipeptide ABC transporter ATP-binding protein
MSAPLVSAHGVNVVYEPNRGTRIWSVRDVDLDLAEGEFVGLVGESGCGKSTLGYALTRLLQPPGRIDSGSITFDGTDIASLSGEALRRQRRNGFALVLQSGMNALNPVRTVGAHFTDILKAHERDTDHYTKASMRARCADLLGRVELKPEVMDLYPHEMSGGMRQRVVIAMALALEPRFIVFDEPTTALDVMVQKAVMNTIKSLQASEKFTALLISHDLGTVLEATDRLLVMYAGRIIEDQPSAGLPGGVHHPYTDALLGCYGDPRAEVVELHGIRGMPPDLSTSGGGCLFADRCEFVTDGCRDSVPPLTPVDTGRVACFVRAPAGGVAVGPATTPGAGVTR